MRLFRVYNNKTLKLSWEKGATMWVVNGSPDGIIVISKDNVSDLNALKKQMKFYFEKENLKQYTVNSNLSTDDV